MQTGTRSLVISGLRLVLAAGLLVGGTTTALAAVFTWDGGSDDDDNWTTGANWEGSAPTAPTPADTDLVFTGANRLTPNNDFSADSNFRHITFDAGAGAFTLDGNDITWSWSNNQAGVITNNSSNLQTINFAMAMPSARSFAGTGDIVAAGILSGPGGVTKTGSGTLTLSGANTYTGPTRIQEGTLKLGAHDSLPSATWLPMGTGTQNATFDLAGFNQTIGTLESVGTGSHIITNTGSNASTLTVTMNSSQTFSGQIIDGDSALSLVKAGAHTLTLTGANTYTGTTTISAGALRISHGSALGSTAGGTTVSSGARLELAGGITVTGEAITISGSGGNFIGALQSQSGANTWAGPVTLGADHARIGADGAGQTLTVSGVIDDGPNTYTLGIRNAAGGGTTVLSGANTYGGNTDVIVGLLRIAGGDNRLPTGTVLRIGNDSNTGTATFDLNGFNQQVAGLTDVGTSMARTVTNSAAALSTLTVNNASSYTYGGTVTGNLALAKLGAGTLTLSGANTYTGTTTVNGGTLILQNTNASPSYSIAGGAALEINVASGSRDMATATFSGTGTLRKTGAGQVVWGATAATFNLGAGALIDVQGGTFIGGSSANEVWTNNAADLNVATGALFNGVEANVRVGALSGGGTIRTGWSGAGYSTFTFGVGDRSGTFSGLLSHNDGTAWGHYTKVGTGTQTFTGTVHQIANGGGTGLTIQGGTVELGGSGTFTGGSWSNAMVNNGAFHYNTTANNTMSGVISGSGSLIKSNTGTLTLTGANSYTGTTTISGGALRITHGGALGSTSGITTVATGARLELDGGVTVSGQTIQLGGDGGSAGSNSGALRSLDGYNVWNGPVILDGPGGTTGTRVGAVNAGSILEIAGPIQDGTQNSVTIRNQNGKTIFSGANTYTGETRLFNGTLELGAHNSLPVGNPLLLGTASLNAVFDLKGFDQTIGTLRTEGTGTKTITNTGPAVSTLTITQNSNQTFEGLITNGTHALNLVKAGGSTLTLSGNNTYTGTTTISGGTLQVGSGGGTGTLGSGNIVNNAALIVNRTGTLTLDQAISGTGSLTKQGGGTLTLSGANTYTGTTTISAGRLTIAHDNALGSTAGGTTVAGGATLALEGGITVAEPITSIGSGASVGTILNLTGNNTLTGNITKAGVTRFQSDAGLLTIGGNVGGNDNSVFLSGAGDGLVLGNMSPGWSFTKQGSGTWTVQGSIGTLNGAELAVQGGTLILAGNNTYARPTNVNAGTLLVNGSTAAGSTVTVNTGATLGGIGTIAGDVMVNDGGILSPGESAGILNLGGNLTFQGGGFFDVDIDDVDLADLVQMSGGLLTPGDATIRVNLGFRPELGDTWTILQGESDISGLFNPDVAMLSGAHYLDGWKWLEVGYGNSVYLTVVPEPATWLLLLAALACSLLVRRRK